jgi:hypothetical protein
VIAFMVWMWFSIMTVLVGAELNAEIEHQTAIDSTTGPEKPMGERGAAMADTVGLAFHPWEFTSSARRRHAGQRRGFHRAGFEPFPYNDRRIGDASGELRFVVMEKTL